MQFASKAFPKWTGRFGGIWQDLVRPTEFLVYFLLHSLWQFVVSRDVFTFFLDCFITIPESKVFWNFRYSVYTTTANGLS